MKDMKPWVIIVHYGEISLTRQCVALLKKHEPSIEKIVIVNNNLQPVAASAFPETKSIVLNNNKNLGFAGGVNVGIAYALSHKAETILFLNNDVRVMSPFLEQLTKDLVGDKKLGIIAPAIKFEKDGKERFDIGGYVNLLTGRTHHQEVLSIERPLIHTVPYVTGAAMLVKKEVFKKIGLFDTSFFLYYEDVDFCLRARKAGFGVAVDTGVTVTHLLSKTIGKVSGFAVYHQTRSAIIFGKKYMKGISKRMLHRVFLLAQTTFITLKFPRAGIAGWKAFFLT